MHPAGAWRPLAAPIDRIDRIRLHPVARDAAVPAPRADERVAFEGLEARTQLEASRVAESHAWLSTVTAHVPRRRPIRCTTSALAVSGSSGRIR